jgi:hypothetical protein
MGTRVTVIAEQPWTLHDYPLIDYPFAELVADELHVDDLTGLSADLPQRTWRTDQQSPWHGLFYDGFTAWCWLFDLFVREVIGPLVGEPFYYQAVPTFRVHLPGNVAVGEVHTDAQYNHPPGEINYWLPLTPAADTASVWIQGDDGMLHAPDVEPGQFVEFSAVTRRHGNKINQTGRSRVSFDFRALPVRLLPLIEGPPTEHTKLRFVPGGYYAAEPISP